MKKTNRHKIISDNIRLIRHSKRLSQVKLAKMAELSQSTIAQVEKGGKCLSLDTLFKICDAFEITPESIMVKLKINF